MDEFKRVFALAYSSPLALVGLFLVYAMIKNKK